jgi:hypothetical protein
MGRIKVEPLGHERPPFADELVGCEALQGLESAAKGVGDDEVGKVAFKLRLLVLVIALDGGGELRAPISSMKRVWTQRWADASRERRDAPLESSCGFIGYPSQVAADGCAQKSRQCQRERGIQTTVAKNVCLSNHGLSWGKLLGVV